MTLVGVSGLQEEVSLALANIAGVPGRGCSR